MLGQDPKVVNLYGQEVHSPLPPVPNLISLCEELLSLAKSGKLQNILLVADIEGRANYQVCSGDRGFGWEHLGGLNILANHIASGLASNQKKVHPK